MGGEDMEFAQLFIQLNAKKGCFRIGYPSGGGDEVRYIFTEGCDFQAVPPYVADSFHAVAPTLPPT